MDDKIANAAKLIVGVASVDRADQRVDECLMDAITETAADEFAEIVGILGEGRKVSDALFINAKSFTIKWTSYAIYNKTRCIFRPKRYI